MPVSSVRAKINGSSKYVCQVHLPQFTEVSCRQINTQILLIWVSLLSWLHTIISTYSKCKLYSNVIEVYNSYVNYLSQLTWIPSYAEYTNHLALYNCTHARVVTTTSWEYTTRKQGWIEREYTEDSLLKEMCSLTTTKTCYNISWL